MRYIIVAVAILFFTACGSNTTQEPTSHTDSITADSIKKQQEQEEEEMSKEIIEGSFDALNR